VGTHATVPPSVEERVCQRLGLQVAPVSNQVIQRDRHAHFVTTLALIAASLEKFATEIRGLQRTEIHEVEEPFDAGQTGSSSMPHKRNPELAERICGLSRLLRGYCVTALENVALWGERDISHSSAERIILPDSCLALDYMLSIFTRIIRQLRVFPDRMWANVESSRGLVFSQRVLLALVDKGLSREAAYEVVQRNAMRSWDNNEDFRELLKADPETLAYLSAVELEELFDYRYYTRYVDAAFERLGLLPAKAAV
jgi:adenylosuccinate lyase